MRLKKAVVVSLLVFAGIMTLVFCPLVVQAQTQKDQVIFAYVDPLSGPFSAVGTEQLYAVEFAVDQINAKGGLLGKPLKLMKYDSQNKPDVAVRAARRAVLEDGAKVIFSSVSSACVLALSKLAVELNVINVSANAAADEITGSQFEPNTFRVSLNTSMSSAMLAQYYAPSSNKRYYLLNMDYVFGHSMADSFKRIFQKLKKADQEIVGEDFHPMATKDFGPYVTKAIAARPDVIITGNLGPDLIGFIKQARALGYKGGIGTYFLDSPSWCEQVGDAGIGVVVAGGYRATIPTKANQDFLKSWQAWFKKNYPNEPIHYMVPATSSNPGQAVLFVAEAVKKAGSADAEKLAKAMEGLTVDSVAGTKITMRACDHQAQMDGWVALVKKDHAFENYIKGPYLGEPTRVPVEKISVPPRETGNPRCK